jgi:tetratricopeptide (TPR) repeat protein
MKTQLLVIAIVVILCACRNNQKTRDSSQNGKADTIRLEKAKPFFNRAAEESDKQDFVAAFNDLSEAIKIDPDYAGAYCMRAVARTESGDTNGTMSDFNEAINQNPQPLFYYFRGLYEWNYLHDSIQGLADESSAIKINPFYVKSLELRYEMRSALGDHSGASDDVTQLIKLDSTKFYNYRYRGIEEYAIQHYEKAIEDFSKAIDLNKNDTDSYFDRGMAERKSEKYKDAFSDFTYALKLYPNFGLAYYNRGLIEIELSEHDKGCQDFHKAEDLGVKKATEELSKNRCGVN